MGLRFYHDGGGKRSLIQCSAFCKERSFIVPGYGAFQERTAVRLYRLLLRSRPALSLLKGIQTSAPDREAARKIL